MKQSWDHEQKRFSTEPKSYTQIFAYTQIEILNNFLCVEVPLCIKDMRWNTPP